MADVFISYSRLDHERVKLVAERLTSLGYIVWWERSQRAGQAAVDEIERQLDEARVVLAAWSHNARNATWVCAESSRALDANKLAQLRLDQSPLPAPFDSLPVADMSNERAGEWGPLEDTLARIVRDGRPPDPSRTLPGAGLLPAAQAAGSPKLLTLATGVTLVAFSSALSATYNGVMSPEQLQVALVGVLGVGSACAALTAHRLFSISRAGG